MLRCMSAYLSKTYAVYKRWFLLLQHHLMLYFRFEAVTFGFGRGLLVGMPVKNQVGFNET